MPNDCELLGFFNGIYLSQGRWREALVNFQRVEDLDPLEPNSVVGMTHFWLRDWPAAAFQRWHQIAPENEYSNVSALSENSRKPGDEDDLIEFRTGRRSLEF